MDWYYAQGKERRGPVSEAQIAELIGANIITADTLVWNNTLKDWQNATSAGLLSSLPPGTQRCIITGKTFLISSMIQTEHGWVSAEGRDTYYQCLREGVPFPAPAGATNAYRDGSKIVVPIGDPRLPLRCIKTNQPVDAKEVVRKKLYWCPPLLYLSILLSIIVLFILYLIFRKLVKIDIPLSRRGRSIVRNHGLITFGLVVAGIVMIATPAAMDGPVGGAGGFCIFSGFLVILGALIYGALKACALRVTKVSDGKAWLAGASPEFLASLPTYPR